jgi:flagellar biosynthesis/type III secretory pathway protein FliH
MNTQPPQKPPTRESVEAAQRFAASLPALPQPQERKPVDYASGFVEGYEKGYEKGYQAALRNAEEMINKILKK